MEVEEIIRLLNLNKHPEGGYYRETYRSDVSVAAAALPSGYSGDRSISTCIYYLLTPDTFSCLHKVSSDEIFHFYLGDPIEMLQLLPDGTSATFKIGQNLAAGETPQLLIKRGVWQGSRLLAGGSFGLIGATVAPGFDFADYEEGARAELIRQYPDRQALITALTRKP
jgi:predicted cupin superfamily sugar epimerase